MSRLQLNSKQFNENSNDMLPNADKAEDNEIAKQQITITQDENASPELMLPRKQTSKTNQQFADSQSGHTQSQDNMTMMVHKATINENEVRNSKVEPNVEGWPIIQENKTINIMKTL